MSSSRRRTPLKKMEENESNDNLLSDDYGWPPPNEYKMDSADISLLDLHENEARKDTIYRTNRPLFLLQSFLLGLSYAIIWPTIWTYIDLEFVLDMRYKKLVYGATYIAYPLASMLSAQFVERIQLDAKKIILFLNIFEIIGNLIYTLNYNPLLPLAGRFIAGLGDAFYIVLMKEMKNKYGQTTNEKMTIECLTAFIIGIVLAPGINVLTTFIHFDVKTWSVNSNNYPGLTMAVLFFVMEFLIWIFVTNDIQSIGSNGKSTMDEKPTRYIDTGILIHESAYKTLLVVFSSFIYTYIVASFEIMIPLVLYESIQTNAIGAMLTYAVIGILYAIFLMISMTVSFKHQLETFLAISIVFQVAGLFALLYFQYVVTVNYAAILSLIVLVLSVTTMWSNDDVLFINYVQAFIPPSLRENAHDIRKFVSKFAFIVAGFTVPFWYSNAVYVVAPLLISIVFALFVCFVVVRINEKKYYGTYD